MPQRRATTQLSEKRSNRGSEQIFHADRAGSEHDGRPNKSRTEIRKLELNVGHLEDACGQRHKRAKWAKETADEDAWNAPASDEILGALEHVGVARQWPHFGDVVLEA